MIIYSVITPTANKVFSTKLQRLTHVSFSKNVSRTVGVYGVTVEFELIRNDSSFSRLTNWKTMQKEVVFWMALHFGIIRCPIIIVWNKIKDSFFNFIIFYNKKKFNKGISKLLLPGSFLTQAFSRSCKFSTSINIPGGQHFKMQVAFLQGQSIMR